MELCSLHPYDMSLVAQFVAAVNDPAWIGSPGRDAIASIERGESRGVFNLTYALATAMAGAHPVFAHAGVSLTTWEARVDRGMGMLLRPPARLLIDAGLEPRLARALPIRLDPSLGMMGGAFIPARLVPELRQQLDLRLERTVRRLIDAEMDPFGSIGAMWAAAEYAEAHGCGIFEAIDVISPDGNVPAVPSARVLMPQKRSLERTLRDRIEAAAKPPKKPSVWSRLRGRSTRASDFPEEGNGR